MFDPKYKMKLTLVERDDYQDFAIEVSFEPQNAIEVIGAVETVLRRMELIGPDDMISLASPSGAGTPRPGDPDEPAHFPPVHWD